MKMRAFTAKVVAFAKKNSVAIVFVTVYAALATATFLVSWRELFDRLAFELKPVANYDTFLYFTVGHGLAEGVTPYSGLYENKGPMIFLVSAISYKLFGNYRLVNVLSFLCVLAGLIVPAAFCVAAYKKHKPNYYLFIPVAIFLFGGSALLTDFMQGHSEAVQVETFGTAFSLLAILFSYLVNLDGQSKFYSPSVILCGACVGVATMFKEPFSLICAAGILLFTHTKKDVIYKVMFPILWCFLTCFVILLLSGATTSYFTVYLSNMFSSHLTKYGSPFTRMLDVQKVFSYYGSFSFALPALIIVSMVVSTVKELLTDYSEKVALNVAMKLLCALKPFAVLYVATFAVGLGGQYYNHHYVFAEGVFFAYMLSAADFILSVNETYPSFSSVKKLLGVADNSGEEKQTAALRMAKFAFIPALVAFSVVWCMALSVPRDYDALFNKTIAGATGVTENAKYIDDILYAVDKDTYTYIGFNGYTPCAYTEHLPSGPCFAQDKNNFTSEDTYFSKELVRQLDETDVIVFSYLNAGVMNEYVSAYIAENFTTAAPSVVSNARIEKPETFRYKVYYRILAFA